jgi:hypothetical protein
MAADTVEHWEGQLQYWRREAITNERLLRIMLLLPVAGIPLALIAGHYNFLIGVLVGVSTLMTVTMGTYMTLVRRYEFRAEVYEAEAALRRLRG